MNKPTSLFSLFVLISSFSFTTDYKTFFTSRLKEACPTINVGAKLGDEGHGPCEMIYNALWFAHYGKVKPWLEDYYKVEHVMGGFASYNARAEPSQPESLCLAIEAMGAKLGWTNEMIKEEVNNMLKQRSALLWEGRKKRIIPYLMNWADHITPDSYDKFQRRKNA